MERTVQTIKNILKKCKTSGDDPNIAILNYHNTPLEVIGKSPAQLLMNRRLRTRIPIKYGLLKPEVPKAVHQTITHRQAIQKCYYDTRASKQPQPNLHAGNKVRFKSPKGLWKLGIISDKKPLTPRSYNVTSEYRHSYRRNHQDIFTTNEVCLDNKPKPKDITITTTPMHTHAQAPVIDQG